MSHISKEKIDKAIEKADKELNYSYEMKHKGNLEATLSALSDDYRQYMKDLLSETLIQLFGKKHHKKD